MRSDAAFPWPAFIKVTFLTICSILFFVGAAGAETSRGVPESPGHPARRHTSVELAKVRRAAVSARRRIRSVAAKKSKRASTGAHGVRGQQVISSERAAQIQSALIREHYLDGGPSGVWDQRTKDAMSRYQAENGWQTKITPDSRALIKLGLGPRHDGLLNPDSAALGSPHELGVEREIPGGH